MLWAVALLGQQPFAPLGAKWYVGYGTWDNRLADFKVIEPLGDTIVNGLTLQKIGEAGGNLPPDLLYQDSSRVYFWSSTVSELRLIYDFGVTTGDSVGFKFDIPFPDNGVWEGVVIKDTLLETISGEIREITCELTFSDPSSWGVPIQYAYAERIGMSIGESTFIPQKSPLIPSDPRDIFIPIPGVPTPFLRCYQDDSVSYRSPFYATFGNLPCDYRQPVSIDPAEHAQLQLFPNPTTGLFTLTLPINTQAYPVHGRLFDLKGRVVKDFAFAGRDLTLDLSDVPVGLYGLEVYAGEELLGREKVWVWR